MVTLLYESLWEFVDIDGNLSSWHRCLVSARQQPVSAYYMIIVSGTLHPIQMSCQCWKCFVLVSSKCIFFLIIFLIIYRISFLYSKIIVTFFYIFPKLQVFEMRQFSPIAPIIRCILSYFSLLFEFAGL
uniref:Uncharacterized protein n=1 Tax=Clastoptera arizonana TaxID=38151 RepID=A0A1B6D8B6_9HEMI